MAYFLFEKTQWQEYFCFWFLDQNYPDFEAKPRGTRHKKTVTNNSHIYIYTNISIISTS